MKNCDVLPLTIDFIGFFFKSSRDALERAAQYAQSIKSHHVTGLTVFPNKSAETQATLETVIFSFMTIEATINYIFFKEQEEKYNQSGIDRWLKNKWRGGLSISDRFFLLFNKYSSADLNKFQNVSSLFNEFISFRNRIVHSYPDKYDALVEFSDIPGEVFIHDVEPRTTHKPFPYSGLTDEMAKIKYTDAARCYEIMLIVLALINAQFVAELEFFFEDKTNILKSRALSPHVILLSLEPRYYPHIDPKTFFPEFLSGSKK